MIRVAKRKLNSHVYKPGEATSRQECPNLRVFALEILNIPKIGKARENLESWGKLGRAGESLGKLGQAGESWGNLGKAGKIGGSWGKPPQVPGGKLRKDRQRSKRLANAGRKLKKTTRGKLGEAIGKT